MEFRVDPETGRFDYSLDPVFARPGDRIEWVSRQGPWAVQHVPLSPFETLRIQGGPGEVNGAQVRLDVTYGKYAYFVAVEVDGVVWTDDPTNIMEPR